MLVTVVVVQRLQLPPFPLTAAAAVEETVPSLDYSVDNGGFDSIGWWFKK